MVLCQASPPPPPALLSLRPPGMQHRQACRIFRLRPEVSPALDCGKVTIAVLMLFLTLFFFIFIGRRCQTCHKLAKEGLSPMCTDTLIDMRIHMRMDTCIGTHIEMR